MQADCLIEFVVFFLSTFFRRTSKSESYVSSECKFGVEIMLRSIVTDESIFTVLSNCSAMMTSTAIFLSSFISYFSRIKLIVVSE